MLQFRIKRNKLTELGYCVGDVTYNLKHLKTTPAWDVFESLLITGDITTAEQLYKLAYSMSRADWTRVESGLWYVRYGGHTIEVVSTDAVKVSPRRTNQTSRVPIDHALLAAEIAYYLRRHKYYQRVAQTAKRDARRAR
jgi:hypothetical protein